MQIPSELLSLSAEPAILARADKIVYANAAAAGILGADHLGKSLRSYFGAALCEVQASVFVCSLCFENRQYTARVMRHDSAQIVYFTPLSTPGQLIDDAFIMSIRNHLMNSGIAIDLLRTSTDLRCDRAVLRQLAILSKNYCLSRRMISNISILHAVGRGEQHLNLRSFDLHELVGSLIATIAPLRPDVCMSLSESAALPVTADATLIEQAMLNLISNCLAHARGLSRICICLLESGGSVVISVGDDGGGIDRDTLSTVFDRYRYLDFASCTSCGAGLGLSVVREICVLHGGTVLIESREDCGTTVRLSLPQHGHVNLGASCVLPPPAQRAVVTAVSDGLPLEYFMEHTNE